MFARVRLCLSSIKWPRTTRTTKAFGRNSSNKQWRALAAVAPVVHSTGESSPPSLGLVAAVFVGLPLALWSYKCLMIYLFQRKIIYMGYAPPGARTEALADHLATLPKGIVASEVKVSSERGIALAGILVHHANTTDPETVIVYLQGNAGSPLHRLPLFSALLAALHPAPTATFAVAPRSYWKSAARAPSQRALTADYAHALRDALRRFPRARIVLYGHSLGGAAAVCLLAALPDDPRVRGLVLENPFASIPGMVRALYPQRWLPYHHMAPLAWDEWDAVSAMAESTAPSPPAPAPSAVVGSRSVLARLRKDTMVILSERDELVPSSMGERIYAAARTGTGGGEGLGRRVVIRGALHEDAWTKREWAKEMRRYLEDIAKQEGQ